MEMRDRTAWLHGDHFHCLQTPAAGRPWRLVLLGPPGVGKATQANLLADLLGACPLSTGDIFRAAREWGGSYGMVVANDHVMRGELVPDDIVLRLLRERTGCLRCRSGFLLNGLPRTLRQATALDGLLDSEHLRLDAVIVYQLPATQLIERLSGRRVCPRCDAPYHVFHHPPVRDGLCDHCGGQIVQRPDDVPELVSRRLEEYADAAERVLEYYRDRHRVVTVSAFSPPDEVFAHTIEKLAAQGLDVPIPTF